MKIKLDPGAYMPTRAHSTDAGLDLYSPVDCVVWGKWHKVIDTGVHIAFREGEYGEIQPKSGLNVKHNILSFGTIDEGYTGAIKVKLYNMGLLPYRVKRGQKITQIVTMPYFSPELELVDELDATERGDNGFGSTGK